MTIYESKSNQSNYELNAWGQNSNNTKKIEKKIEREKRQVDCDDEQKTPHLLHHGNYNASPIK